MMKKNIVFLKARWENLLMANYRVDAEVLKPYLPPGTELDLWQGEALVSMVGFLFKDTKVLSVKWPLHVNFQEVNLRFYVRYFDGSEWKRGAVFISEIVPKPMIVFIANTLFNENYSFTRMRHSITQENEKNRYVFEWRKSGRWNTLAATVSDTVTPMQAGSAEEFIFEHYWGYNRINDHKTMEYAVEHPRWEIAAVSDYVFDAEIKALYGDAFVPYLSAEPVSVFFSPGSEVLVRKGKLILS